MRLSIRPLMQTISTPFFDITIQSPQNSVISFSPN